MKKILASLVLVLMVMFGASMAIACSGPGCIETVDVTAIAAPTLFNGSNNPWGNATGGWSTGAAGFIQVDAFAQGNKSAEATAWAHGDAFGIGAAAGIQTPCFGIGASGAFSAVAVEGTGYGLGKDKFSFWKNPDSAFVAINYSGQVEQANGILVDNGEGTFAGGQNSTGAIFSGGSSFNSCEFKLIDWAIPSLAIGCDAAGAYAGGYTIAGYVDTPNFAASTAKTVGFSGYVADQGAVYGTGMAQTGAATQFGAAGGTATFCFSGNANFGAGSAQTQSWVAQSAGQNSTSVTAFSTGRAQAGTK
jgi:hypothetical protein